MRILDRIVRRFLSAGNVLEFKGKPQVHNTHFIKIHNEKYFLSDDAGALMDALQGLSGGTVVQGPQHGSPFKYLWALDTERKYLHMWRTTDGNYKESGSANSMAVKIAQLDKRQQLNRVNHASLMIISREMEKLQDAEMEAMKKSIAENETDSDKIINQYTKEYFEKYVRPLIDRAVAAIEGGATPLGFKPHDDNPANRKRQMITRVISDVMGKKFNEELVAQYIESQGYDLNAPGVDNQAVEWAVSQYLYGVYDEYLPERVRDSGEW